jgi:hypothetical protein
MGFSVPPLGGPALSPSPQLPPSFSPASGDLDYSSKTFPEQEDSRPQLFAPSYSIASLHGMGLQLLLEVFDVNLEVVLARIDKNNQIVIDLNQKQFEDYERQMKELAELDKFDKLAEPFREVLKITEGIGLGATILLATNPWGIAAATLAVTMYVDGLTGNHVMEEFGDLIGDDQVAMYLMMAAMICLALAAGGATTSLFKNGQSASANLAARSAMSDSVAKMAGYVRLLQGISFFGASVSLGGESVLNMKSAEARYRGEVAGAERQCDQASLDNLAYELEKDTTTLKQTYEIKTEMIDRAMDAVLKRREIEQRLIRI